MGQKQPISNRLGITRNMDLYGMAEKLFRKLAEDMQL